MQGSRVSLPDPASRAARRKIQLGARERKLQHRLVEQEKESEQADDSDTAWALKSAASLPGEIPPVKFDVQDLIEKDSGPVMIFGMPESLKSWIALHVSRCMLTGEPVFGHFAVERRPESVFLNFDAPQKALERRIALMRNGMDDGGAERFLYGSPDSFEADYLRATMEAHQQAFVTLDSFADIYSHDPKVEQGEAMRVWLRAVRKLYEANGCNGIVVDHSRRPTPGASSETERYYGSIQKKAGLRQMWFVQRLRSADDDPSAVRVKIVCEKLSEAEKFKPFVIEVRFSPAGVTFTYVGPMGAEMAKADAAARHRDVIEPLLRDAPQGLTRAQLEKLTSLSKEQVLAAIKTPGIAAVGGSRNRRYILSEGFDGDADDSATDSSFRRNTLRDADETMNTAVPRKLDSSGLEDVEKDDESKNASSTECLLPQDDAYEIDDESAEGDDGAEYPL